MGPLSRRSPRLALTFVVLILVAAACSSSGDTATTTTVTVAPTADAAATTTAAPVTPSPGQLLITDEAGRIAIVDPDGNDLRAVVDDGAVYFQPVWSPDATRLSAGRVGPDGSTDLAVIDVAAGKVTLAAAAATPFYSYWSPDGSRVAYLNSSVEGSIDFTIHEPATGATDIVETGAPYYFSWAPDSRALATHVGTAKLDIRSLDGRVEPLTEPGAFQAPQWTPEGLVHVGQGSSTSNLMVTREDGSERVLGEVRGPSFIVATREGSRLAMRSTSDQDAVSAVASGQQVPLLPANRLVVIDVATGEWTTVTAEPVVAFFWDPTGTRLLYMNAGDRSGTVAWNMWEDGEVVRFESHVPGASFVRDVLPFFDQYALSVSLWSPDGERFAYPAERDGDQVIMVQEAVGGVALDVATGSWVAWSPGR